MPGKNKRERWKEEGGGGVGVDGWNVDADVVDVMNELE